MELEPSKGYIGNLSESYTPTTNLSPATQKFKDAYAYHKLEDFFEGGPEEKSSDYAERTIPQGTVQLANKKSRKITDQKTKLF